MNRHETFDSNVSPTSHCSRRREASRVPFAALSGIQPSLGAVEGILSHVLAKAFDSHDWAMTPSQTEMNEYSSREEPKMRKLLFSLLLFAIVVTTLVSPDASAGQRRRVVVRHPVRHPVVHTRLVIHARHPIRRALPAAVVVRSARRPVVVGAPLIFLPALAWAPAVVPMPARERLVWQDSEVIERDEGWVDTNFGIDSLGNALFLDITGKADFNFAEVTFANGNVQVVDFNERSHETGIYKLLDFAGGRHVKTVRILAKSESENTKLVVYLGK